MEATREDKIAFIKSQMQDGQGPGPSREDKIAFIKSQMGQGDPSPEESPIKRMARSTIDMAVPAAGAITAGALATPETLGAGTIEAGSLGYAAGKQLARILNHYILGDEMQAKGAGEIAGQTANDLKNGAMIEMGGRVLGELPGLAKAGVDKAKDFVKNQIGAGVEFTPSANSDAVQAAAKRLGLDTPKAVLTDNPTYQKLESGLSQSGSLPAKDIRNQYNDFFKGVNDASGKIEELKTPQSDFSIGKSLKDDLAAKVEQSRAPVTELYNDVTPDLQKIPVNKGTVNRVFGALKTNPIFQTSDGKAMLNEYKSVAAQQPELNSLKELRTTVGKSLDKGGAEVDGLRLSAIQDALTSVRDKSINMMKATGDLDKKGHAEVDDLIDKLTMADQAHSSNIKDLNSIKSILGNKEVKSPGSFLRNIGNAKEADIAERAANLDVASLQNLKDKFPSVFDKAQAAKINDMVQRSMNPASGFNVNTFMKQYENLDKETKDLIFSPEIQSHIQDLKTIRQAIPPKLGPSGTPEGQMMMDMLNPKRNALDYGIKKVLSGAGQTSTPEISTPNLDRFGSISKPASILQMSGRSPAPQPQSALPAAASNGPTKGPGKWANDGLNKLIDHAQDPKEKQTLQDQKGAMLDDPKTKDLLIKASDLQPGSKAMQNLMAQVKARIKKGDE